MVASSPPGKLVFTSLEVVFFKKKPDSINAKYPAHSHAKASDAFANA